MGLFEKLPISEKFLFCLNARQGGIICGIFGIIFILCQYENVYIYTSFMIQEKKNLDWFTLIDYLVFVSIVLVTGSLSIFLLIGSIKVNLANNLRKLCKFF